MTDDEKRLSRNAQARDYYHNWGGREYWQKYYLAHRNEYCERSKACYQANKERFREYYQEHHEERLAYQRAYRARKKAEKLRKESELS